MPGVRPVTLSRWDKKSDTFMHCFQEPEIQAKLAVWAGCTPKEWAEDVARREAYLEKMQQEGVRGISQTRNALKRFSRDDSP